MITTFTASISALGTHIRLVALQDDHEGLREIVLTLTQEECRELTELMAGQVATARLEADRGMRAAVAAVEGV